MDKDASGRNLKMVFRWGTLAEGRVITDPLWEQVEPILDKLRGEQDFDGIEVEIIEMVSENSYKAISGVQIMSDGDYYLAMYTDDFEGGRYCISPHNPDPNDEGEIELGGNDWDKAILRKDFSFLRAIFKEYITHRKIPLELFLSKKSFD